MINMMGPVDLLIISPLPAVQPELSGADYCIERGAIITTKVRLPSVQSDKLPLAAIASSQLPLIDKGYQCTRTPKSVRSCY
jgi:hypothetical protein